MSRHAPAPGRAKGGFVLVEMLVAMAVGAFLLVALASVTTFLLRAHDRAAAHAQEAEEAGRALAALARETRPAAPLKWAGRDAALVFSGTSDRLLFARAATGGIEAVLLQAQVKSGGTELLIAKSPLPPVAAGPDALAWGPPAPLYSGSSRISFAYFMRLDGGGEALLDDWPAGNEMPVAVRVSLLPSRPGGQALSLRLPLPVDAEPACALPDAPGCGNRPEEPAAESGEAAGGAVDANDPLGWERYAR